MNRLLTLRAECENKLGFHRCDDELDSLNH